MRLPLLAGALLLALAAPSVASADSIVYEKQGNLFLTSPDGSQGYQLTTDGGYSYPSQADNGVVGALRYDRLVRLDRSGHPLNAPVATVGTDSAQIGGPYEPKLSPDASRFAYYFYVQTSFDDYENHVRWIDTGSYTSWTPADHFALPEYDKSLTQAEWLTNDRLLGTQGFWMNMWTWKIGTGSGYTWNAGQWWFGLQDPPDEWGVAAYHWYDDPALSRDGTKLAMTDSGQQLVLAATHGPAYSGEPPYPEPDYLSADSGFTPPTIMCRGPVGKVVNPTWSSDGSMLAYGAADGVHVMTVPADLDCSKTTDRLLIPGGANPAFGPADVVAPAAAPAPAPAPTRAPAPTAPKLSAVSLKPRAFHASGGTTLRFTLSAPARVTFTILHGKKARGTFAVAGRAGANRVRFKRRLPRGSYTLRSGAVSTGFRVI